jgi:hypothetical protein
MKELKTSGRGNIVSESWQERAKSWDSKTTPERG